MASEHEKCGQRDCRIEFNCYLILNNNSFKFKLLHVASCYCISAALKHGGHGASGQGLLLTRSSGGTDSKAQEKEKKKNQVLKTNKLIIL